MPHKVSIKCLLPLSALILNEKVNIQGKMMPLLPPVSDCPHFPCWCFQLLEDALREMRSLLYVTVEMSIKLRNAMEDWKTESCFNRYLGQHQRNGENIVFTVFHKYKRAYIIQLLEDNNT